MGACKCYRFACLGLAARGGGGGPSTQTPCEYLQPTLKTYNKKALPIEGGHRRVVGWGGVGGRGYEAIVHRIYDFSGHWRLPSFASLADIPYAGPGWGGRARSLYATPPSPPPPPRF